MSTQKGNTRRIRAQKHQNVKAFKNTMHETNKKALSVNRTEVEGCCSKCTEVIEWKIKYKKYKPLTVPKKCVRCDQKSVKRAYCIVCPACVEKLNICAKCTEEKELVNQHSLTEGEQARQLSQAEQELRLLPERKRRTFLRQLKSGKLTEDAEGGNTISHGQDSDDSQEYSDGEESAEDEDIDVLDDQDENIQGSSTTEKLDSDIACPVNNEDNDDCEESFNNLRLSGSDNKVKNSKVVTFVPSEDAQAMDSTTPSNSDLNIVKS